MGRSRNFEKPPGRSMPPPQQGTDQIGIRYIGTLLAGKLAVRQETVPGGIEPSLLLPRPDSTPDPGHDPALLNAIRAGQIRDVYMANPVTGEPPNANPHPSRPDLLPETLEQQMLRRGNPKKC